MSDITKMVKYTELTDPKYRALFKYTDGATVLGVITYENGDVYMGEIKPDEACEEKRDRRRHGYGKLLSKGAVTESQWNTGITVGHTLKISKTGKRSFEIAAVLPGTAGPPYSSFDGISPPLRPYSKAWTLWAFAQTVPAVPDPG